MANRDVSTIISFWFAEITPKQWWIKDEKLDNLISQRFGEIHSAASCGELFSWRDFSHGRLAEIIVLDQFSRNIHRNTPKAFANDPMALALSQEAVRAKIDSKMTPAEKAFLYIPFMHSESTVIHQTAVELYKQPGLEDNYEFELKHKAIIDRFGRYPHRNKILGRASTVEELAFLDQPGSSF